MMNLLVKICGMRDEVNIREVLTLQPDYMGFIFYDKSPRYAENLTFLQHIPFDECKKIGVFVDANRKNIMQKVKMYDLHAVQLHGHESPELCRHLKDAGLIVIKAIRVSAETDLKNLVSYDSTVDYFLFDTKSISYGGTGRKFDWSILQAYQLKTPFFLSGGIALEDVNHIKEMNHPQLKGVDVNSKFEVLPAYKDVKMLHNFIQKLKTT